ncbi:MAG TPA: hypothetical protein VHD15_15965 [Hyphomicrobiales bacterium]|nr:hypothetical protein [Hyphomicrobiales bacterium]
MSALPDRVHLVGTIGLDNVPETFRTVGEMLGSRLRRVPDGEPGGRRLWISWQYPLLRANPYLQADRDSRPTFIGPNVRLGEGVKPEEVRFGELGYAREARASYLDFLAAKRAGSLPQGVRFQVSLPTPLAVIQAFTRPDDVKAIEPAYEAAMLREVQVICDSIPHQDLTIQWDVCGEMVAWDGRMKNGVVTLFEDFRGAIIDRLVRLSEPIPADVELGFHLCYGDLDAKHFIDPLDMGKMVELANTLSERIGRPIAYFHMPVPIDRSDDAYFAPLEQLKLKPGTELYLGCVHAADGAEGTKKRIAAAQRHYPAFGIATECGMGRNKTADVVKNLLAIHAAATEA